MATGHTDERIRKLAARGLSVETIARKIGRPDDVARVHKVLGTSPEWPRCTSCNAFLTDLEVDIGHRCR
jgi:hypothetical protein